MESIERSLERGLALYLDLLREEPEALRELARSRRVFGLAPDGEPEEGDADAAARALRHLEWFVLERPSESLGGAPVEVLQEGWQASAGPGVRDLAESYLGSHASAFVLEEPDEDEPDGGTFLARDVFARTRLPLVAPGRGLTPGDLVVGRVFPLSGGAQLLSPAAGVFRDAALLEALERDVELVRGARRGVLRMQQSELERMFFGAPAEPVDVEPEPERALSEAAARLAAAGLNAARAEELTTQVAAAAARGEGGDAVTEALNRLAFETDVDLELAREALTALWSALPRGAAEEAEPELGDAASEALRDDVVPAPHARAPGRARRDDESGADRARVHAALASFDEGRASGKDLDTLFEALERSLDLAEPDGSEADDGAPDFPGVVGAMIVEYRWESDNARAPRKEPHGWRLLADFGVEMESIGVFEQLSGADLVRFVADTALERGLYEHANDARELLEACAGFVRWSAESQDHSLEAEFDAARPGLEARLPRLADARRALERHAARGGVPYEVAFVGGQRVALRLPLELVELDPGRGEPEELELTLDERVARHLAEGDWVRVRGRGANARIVGVHPPEARASLLRTLDGAER